MTDKENAASEQDNAKSKRVVIRFFNDTGKEHFARPQSNGKGIAIIHNPEGDLATEKFGLKWSDLEKHPDLIRQLAMFGASVHLRNAINTEKDEQNARAKLIARLDAFKAGDYGASTEGASTVPLVIRALELALRNSGKFDEKAIAEKVDKNTEIWHSADKQGKAALRAKIMSNKAVQAAYAELQVKKEKPATEETSLSDF